MYRITKNTLGINTKRIVAKNPKSFVCIEPSLCYRVKNGLNLGLRISFTAALPVRFFGALWLGFNTHRTVDKSLTGEAIVVRLPF